MLLPGKALPTGYVRYATGGEKKMFRRLKDSYNIDRTYVLDMYRQGKIYMILDLAIRAGVGLLLLIVSSVIMGGKKDNPQQG